MTPVIRARQTLRAALAAALPSAGPAGTEEGRYRDLLRDYPLRGGKQVRGIILLLSADAWGADREQAGVIAAALELFQSWVLVHDDIEDDSEERRGQPALHRQVGMPLALNAGDGLHVHMWKVLLDAAPGKAVLDEFLQMISHTAFGQHLDLSWVASGRLDVTAAEYLEMVRLKTGWYTVASPLRLGALLAGQEPDPRFESAGLQLGAAFQIRDDVLNLTSESGDEYGKESAGDLLEAKRTLILARHLATAPAEVADRARSILAGPRSGRSRESVNQLLHDLHDSGAIAYAQRQAELLAAESLGVLRRLLAAAPDQAAAADLLELLESLAHRSS